VSRREPARTNTGVPLLAIRPAGGQTAQPCAFPSADATGFTHANLRWNAGALGWLLVTPQSHRIHHSTEERHWEKNFGAVLSIWDRVFRTQWHGTDDYPTIGIDDTAFPLEQQAGPVPVVHNYFRQVVYPFKRVAADVRKV